MQNKTTKNSVLKKLAPIVLSTVLVSQLFTGFVSGESPDNFVDNSQLPAFPPIRDQGDLPTCEAFSGVYYQMTHMVALQKGWDTKNDPTDTKKFSPKFNSTIVNKTSTLRGKAPYPSLKTFGAMTWNDLPYSGNAKDPKSYLECPTELDKWKNAMNYRIDKTGYVDFSDGTDTPISGPDDPDLLSIKKLLREGQVLTFGTYIDQWQYNPAYIYTKDSLMAKMMADKDITPISAGDLIKDDPNTIADNIDDINTPENEIVVGKKYCYMQNGTDSLSYHEMTVVGYSDDVWCDINMNNKVEIQEKGAFKIANSWGPEWADEGFIYLSYDALNKVSSVPDISQSKSFTSKARVGAIDDNQFKWISVRENYSPKLTAEFTVNHNCVEQLYIEMGYSNSNDSKPSMYLEQSITPGGNCSFDGTDNPNCDASIALDLTDCQKLSNPALKWYLQITDTMADGKKCVLKSFRIIDNRTGAVMTSAENFPLEIDGSTVTIPIQIQKNADPFSSWNLMPSQTGGRLNAAYATHDGTLYAFGGITYVENEGRVCESKEISSFKDGVWTTKTLMGKQLSNKKAHTINNKIYVTDNTSEGLCIYEYTPSDNLWQLKTTSNINRFVDSAVVNGKLYIFDMGEGLFEYNSETNILNKVSEFPFETSNFKVAAANNKIYIFGGTFSRVSNNYDYSNYVWEYDPQNNTWLQKKDMQYTKFDFQAISLNNKIYLFVQDKYYSNSEKKVSVIQS